MDDISLSLSGGGIRAMAFHMGVLQYLSQHHLMEKIKRISTVSGGSLLIGLIIHESSMRWPDSDTYKSCVFPQLQEKLCSKSFIVSMLKLLVNPANIHMIIYRANLLAEALKREWGITYNLSELPEQPEISMNGSTAENGKRFRFKRDTFGDYELGYADSSSFPLAEAMAVSAAFPGGIGPLTIKSSNLKWKKRPHWDAPHESIEITPCPYNKLHLYDGGVYDNLGIEPFFDICTSTPKIENSTLLVSDAGAPYQKGGSYFALNPWRLKRMMDLMSEQTRALRVRSFHGYMQSSLKGCAYIWIQEEIDGGLKREDKDHPCNHPTSLRKLSINDFEKISNHGYAVAKKFCSRQT